MKFLDERITFTVTVDSTYANLPPKGMYTYALVLDDVDSQEEEHDVFIGNFYYNKTYSVTLDLTDIIRNNGSNYNWTREALRTTSDITTDNSIVNGYRLELRFPSAQGGTKTSSTEIVYNVYRYPKRSEYNLSLNGDLQFYSPIVDAWKSRAELLLQGYRTGGSLTGTQCYDLIPHYPIKNTNKYAVAWTFEAGTNVQEIELYLTDGDWDDDSQTLDVGQGCIYNFTGIRPLSVILERYFYQLEHHQYIGNYDITAEANNISRYPILAIFDICPARYYLQWQDRFGSWQSQPFKDNATYSEDIENKESVTYTDSRRKYNVQVQPKWKLNSGWITDRNYIYYESIFVSPVVILYDTKTDMNYEVIVKDKYIEKNYINQKGMVNLQLELEAVEKQNMIY